MFVAECISKGQEYGHYVCFHWNCGQFPEMFQEQCLLWNIDYGSYFPITQHARTDKWLGSFEIQCRRYKGAWVVVWRQTACSSLYTVVIHLCASGFVVFSKPDLFLSQIKPSSYATMADHYTSDLGRLKSHKYKWCMRKTKCKHPEQCQNVGRVTSNGVHLEVCSLLAQDNCQLYNSTKLMVMYRCWKMHFVAR